MSATILLTGASGYVGTRLLRVLEEGGCAVRCLARRPERIAAGWATTEVVSGDCLDEASLVGAMDGVDQAYFGDALPHCRRWDDDRGRRPLRIGISACLLGQQVRFDGGHKRDAFLTETFGRFVEWIPVCPEVECGLGTPREAMRLLRAERGPRLVTVKTARDLTAPMERFARSRVASLAAEDPSGYILSAPLRRCHAIDGEMR